MKCLQKMLQIVSSLCVSTEKSDTTFESKVQKYRNCERNSTDFKTCYREGRSFYENLSKFNVTNNKFRRKLQSSLLGPCFMTNKT